MQHTALSPLRRILGKDDRFFNLLEASAEEARGVVQAISGILRSTSKLPALDDFVSARRKGKQIHEEITELVVRSFVTSLDREDIEALSGALYKIPKAAEKFVERFLLCAELLGTVDFTRHAETMEKAVDHAANMVQTLRRGGRLEKMMVMNAELERIAKEAELFMHSLLRDLYGGKHAFLQTLALRDLYQLLERITDRCAEVGSIVTHIVLKHS